MRAVASDLRPERLDVVSLRLGRCGTGRDECRSTTRFKYGKGPLCDITSDGIEYGVAFGHYFGEIVGVVIDDLIGTEAADIIVVGRAGGRDHMGAYMLGELEGEAGDAARPTLDQDHLAGLEL